jgi:serine/threonine protein phosphatase PrpC
MGTFLSKPDTEKTREKGEARDLKYWGCSMRGWRVTMEDTSHVDLHFDEGTSLFCIFDGHGGDEVARFCESNFAKELKQNRNYALKNYKKALTETFLRMDDLMRTSKGKDELYKYKGNSPDRNVYSGCTALACLIVKDVMFIANAGDCRALLFKSNGVIFQLNKEHKPNDPEELARITRAGGVVLNGRIAEILNLSRAIGDLEYKNNFLLKQHEQMISALPDVIEKRLEPDDVGILLGCDGVYEKLTDTVIRDIILDGMERKDDMGKVLDNVFDETLAPAMNSSFAGYDNMTGILIQLEKKTANGSDK